VVRRSVSSRVRAASAALLVAVPLIAAAFPAAASATAPTDCRPVPAPAADLLGATAARERLGVDGTGVTVGIISDSFDHAGADAVSSDVAAGWLPGPGNPCGWTTPVTVVGTPAPSGSDEGRAMAQVVHGVAPGAEILFATANPETNAAMAAAIDTLRENGADIIVDDLGLSDDLYYARQEAGEAIQRSVDAGVLYVTAAGNYGRVGAAGYPSAGFPIAGWKSEAYRPMPCPADVEAAALATEPPGTSVDCMDFDPSEAADATMEITVAGSPGSPMQLHWAEAAGAVDTAFAVVRRSPALGDAPQATWAPDAQRPVVPSGVGSVDAGPTATDVSIVRRTSPAAGTPAVALFFPAIESFLSIAALEYFTSTATDTVGASMIGHPADPAALPVAAVDATDLTLGFYGSAGPVTTFFGLPEPTTTTGPLVAGIDTVPISFVIGQTTGPGTFSGTSAAAPSVAAVAALMKQAAPDADPARLRAALVDTARPDAFSSPWPADLPAERFSGAGLVDALAAVTAVAPPAPVPTPTPAPSTSAPVADGPPARLAESGTAADAGVVTAGVVLTALGLGILVLRRRRLPS